MSKITFLMTQSDINGNPLNTEHFRVELVEDLTHFVTLHPDTNVDLCAILLTPILQFAKIQNKSLFYRFFDKNFILTKQYIDNEIDAIEDILMIGYPNGLWDSLNNLPILRRGSSATHPNIDYEGKKEFIIDIACFPGSSGSPVLIYNQLGGTSKNGSISIGTPRLCLLGILYAGHQFSVSGEIKVQNIPTNQQLYPLTNIPMNLGLVIKAERILELEQLFINK